ncbi:MAG: hypothetical protein K9H84_01115 [Bacteroidales bacterium]|nr:hypothetical protein [Bacteroidales bacterium]
MNLFPLCGYKVKPVSAGISIALLFLTFTEKLTGIVSNVLFIELNIDQLLFWLILLSVFGVICSKEKTDDERIKHIRGRTFYIAFIMMSALLLALTMLGILRPNTGLNIGIPELLMVVFVSQIIYLLFFYIALYSNARLFYDDKTLKENIIHNIRFYIIYTLIMLTVVIMVFYFL